MLLRKFAWVAGGLLLQLGGPELVKAQTITSGLVEGRVHDPNGQPLADVSVLLIASDGSGTRSASTSIEGVYRFFLLAPGTYSVVIERLGYRPKQINGVDVYSGRSVRLDVALSAAPPPVEAAEMLRYEANAGPSRAGASQFLSTAAIRALPWERRDATEVAALSSITNADLETEGLPGWLTSVLVDGVPYAPARHRDLIRDGQRLSALPLNALQQVEIVTADADAEWSGFAAGAFAAQTRRGTAAFNATSFGAWSGSALATSKYFDPADLSGNSLWGGLALSGPLIRDTAHYFLSFEARQLDTPLARPWEFDDAIDAAVIAVARDNFGVTLDPYTRPYLVRSSLLSGFGRFDWQLADDNHLSVRAGIGSIPGPGADTRLGAAVVPGMLAEGSDLMVSSTLGSMFRRTWAHEIRMGIVRTTRDFGVDPPADPEELPGTRIVSGGLRFGNDPRFPGRFDRTNFTTAQSLEIPASAHRIKIGLDTDLESHKEDYAYARDGAFVFGGPGDFGSTSGSFFQISGGAEASYSIFRLGAFVQDTWAATPELRVVAGLRVDFNTLPGDEITQNSQWLTYTGVANDDVPSSVVGLSPRLGLTWSLGADRSWIVRASAGSYENRVDPAVFSEIVTSDGGRSIRRLVGDLDSWPGAPSAAVSRTELALLGPKFRPPRTNRASLGLSRPLGTVARLHVSGTYRSTDYLPRRADLNLFTSAAAHDQHGRPIFGTLVQAGSIVGALVTSRRFSDFDRVSALNTDGWSRYLGITATIERDAGANTALFASYTYSRTTDNWLSGGAAGADGQLTPFPDEGPVDWIEDVSDFDVPHRVAAGVEIRPSGRLRPRIAARYRYRSGYPFTPGFGYGVDVNADGSGANDPAFIDTSIAGMNELTSEWDCLREQAGHFAARNSCREPGVHALDVRIGLTVGSASGFDAEIFADGINLIESTVADIDRAVYLINPNGTLTQGGGQVALPLMTNPNFGEPLARFGNGRMLRFGLQVNF